MSQYMTEELRRFNLLTSEIDALYHEAALKIGLSDSAMKILYTICIHGDSCLLGDICRLSGTSKQTINSSIRKLEGDGIVYLAAHSGRKKMVCLTNQGKVMVAHTVAPLIEIENQIFASWTKEEQEQYIALTKRYLAVFRQKIEIFSQE